MGHLVLFVVAITATLVGATANIWMSGLKYQANVAADERSKRQINPLVVVSQGDPRLDTLAKAAQVEPNPIDRMAAITELSERLQDPLPAVTDLEKSMALAAFFTACHFWMQDFGRDANLISEMEGWYLYCDFDIEGDLQKTMSEILTDWGISTH